jgi:hypothetical protein
VVSISLAELSFKYSNIEIEVVVIAASGIELRLACGTTIPAIQVAINRQFSATRAA